MFPLNLSQVYFFSAYHVSVRLILTTIATGQQPSEINTLSLIHEKILGEKPRTIIHRRTATSTRPSQSPCPMDPMPKSRSPPQRRLMARRSPSWQRALRSLRLYTHSNGNASLQTMSHNEFVRE